MTQTEFEALLDDTTKRIDSDIAWNEDEDHSPSVEFRVNVDLESGYPLFVRGSYNLIAQKLSYALIHRAVGRIYCLCLGIAHHNPSCERIGDKHKHRWNELTRDKQAYEPEDIVALVTDPVAVWNQFCIEAKITHNGRIYTPTFNQQLEILGC